LFLGLLHHAATLRVSKSTTHITCITLIIALPVSQVFNSIALFKTSEYLAPTAFIVVQLHLAVLAISAVANCWGYHIQAPHSTASIMLPLLHLLSYTLQPQSVNPKSSLTQCSLLYEANHASSRT